MSKLRKRMPRFAKQPSKKIDQRDSPVGGLSPRQLRQIYGYGYPTASGQYLNEETSLSLSAIYRAVSLISTTIASLEYHVYQRLPDGGKTLLRNHPVADVLHYPSDELTDFVFWRTILMQMLCSGVGYAHIERMTNGRPYKFHLIDWRDCDPRREPDDTLYYHLKHENEKIAPADMLVFANMSWDGITPLSPVRLLRDTLQVGLAAQNYSLNLYNNSAVPSGLLELPYKISDDSVMRLRNTWNEEHQGTAGAGKLGILPQGAKFISTMFSPADQELLLSRRFSINEIARVYSVPPNLLFESEQSSYNADEQSNAMFVQFCLRAHLELIEAECDRKLLTNRQRRNTFTEHRIEGLLRGNLSARASYANTLFHIGAITPNEIRATEGLNPVESKEANELFFPVNMATDVISNLPNQPQPAPDTTTDVIGNVEHDVPSADDNRSLVYDVLSDQVGRLLKRGFNSYRKHGQAYQQDMIAQCIKVLPPYARLANLELATLTNAILQGAESLQRESDIGDELKAILKPLDTNHGTSILSSQAIK